MPWVRFDDGYLTHPKVLRAGRDGRDFHQGCIFYAARELTDGFIPNEALMLCSVMAGLPDFGNALERCVAAGLLEVAENGYQVHDYLDYNPSREQVEHNRDVRAEAGRKGGKQKASNLLEASYTSASSKTLAKVYPVPDPDPVPSPVPESLPQEPSQHTQLGARGKPAPVRPDAFDAFWRGYPRKERKPAAIAAWNKLRPPPDECDAILAGLARWQASAQWARGIYPHPATWLNGRQWEDEPEPAHKEGSNGRGPAHHLPVIEPGELPDDGKYPVKYLAAATPHRPR